MFTLIIYFPYLWEKTQVNAHCFHRAYHYTTFTSLRHMLYWLDNTCPVCWECIGVHRCLKVIPSGHSSATWCYMANTSIGVYLPMFIKSGVLDFSIGMIKKAIYVNGKSPSFCNMM